ncbi:membrane protein [Paenibacillus baekrokdamisoli]|uniref:Membrane protein n=1 Tax=Paenibacillus baekrokdamisoli TaxID=1712516 RepID=A0A3G9J657_9BACL|nr:DUF3817 domain-containing protein [Paenibacillus baekrokdamisoli]MBB3072000.1 integral membrane protein [Paenibacillus baekrokdamisoli]BBH20303.1 membrane protein [Paenibacillus baekrokdamisoli]
MLKTALGRFRFIGNMEGTSYLVLLLIAMPLKYWADMPIAVQIVGAIHGLLFTLYLIALLQVWIVKRWSFLRVVIAFLAAFVPIGTYILDAKLRKET